jgi:Ser/Thr protein kinase RdoA (MazF antagonist)
MNIPQAVLAAYRFTEADTVIKAFGTGLINHTWKVTQGGKNYVLQRINTAVFREPEKIADNISRIAAYLAENAPDYFFVAPVVAVDGQQLVTIAGEQGGSFRVFPFVPGSHSKEVATSADQAFEAAKQFGRFTRLLSGFDANTLHRTIPSFHDLSLRYQQFQEALQNGNAERIRRSAALIAYMKDQSELVSRFEAIQNNPDFRIRVTHHDTKISNVLFNEQDQALCVIDLDTVMPGYFISDAGDMMRTYLPTVSEEEKDFSLIDVREDMYHAIVNGYVAEMGAELSAAEKGSFFYAGQFMIYMQALRFLTDYLTNDRYYGASYPEHNFIRAGNQAVLLRKLTAMAL